MNKTSLVGIALGAAVLASSGLWPSAAEAADMRTVRYLAANCANCHGTNGRSVGGMESLAGYDKDKFIQRMSEFKSGKRPATLMHQISKGYSDEQIAQLAEFFSKQPAK